jgi:lipid A 3-O-deacylase
MKTSVLFFLVGITHWVSGQRIDNTASYRTLNTARYFRVHYENDYFSKTDIYYTQGINLEWAHPNLGKSMPSRLLLRSKEKQMKFGFSAEHLGYTPTSISRAEILLGDRPFAAALFLKPFAILNDSVRHYHVVSSVSAGVIGPAAGGKQMQTAIHRWIHDEVPLGWDNQIRNDVVINYQVDFEKDLIPSMKYYSLQGKIGAQVGTFSDKIYGGVIIMAGIFDNPFTSFSVSGRDFRIYVYAEPQVSAVGYDATMQGGLLNRSNPYTLSSAEIVRVVFQYNAGFVLNVKKVYAEYFQSCRTHEFETGKVHHWGGVRMVWSFGKRTKR